MKRIYQPIGDRNFKLLKHISSTLQRILTNINRSIEKNPKSNKSTYHNAISDPIAMTLKFVISEKLVLEEMRKAHTDYSKLSFRMILNITSFYTSYTYGQGIGDYLKRMYGYFKLDFYRKPFLIFPYLEVNSRENFVESIFKNIKSLIFFNRLNINEKRYLNGLKNLTKLEHVTSWASNSKNFIYIKHLHKPSVVSLTLSYETNTSEDGDMFINMLNEFSNIRKLDVNFVRNDIPHTVRLKLPKLEILNNTYFYKHEDFATLKNIREIYICEASFPKNVIENIYKLEHVQTISLESCDMKDTKNLFLLFFKEGLKYLAMWRCDLKNTSLLEQVRNLDPQKYSRFASTLKTLKIYRNSNFSEYEFVDFLAPRANNMDYLVLSFVTQSVTETYEIGSEIQKWTDRLTVDFKSHSNISLKNFVFNIKGLHRLYIYELEEYGKLNITFKCGFDTLRILQIRDETVTNSMIKEIVEKAVNVTELKLEYCVFGSDFYKFFKLPKVTNMQMDFSVQSDYSYLRNNKIKGIENHQLQSFHSFIEFSKENFDDSNSKKNLNEEKFQLILNLLKIFPKLFPKMNDLFVRGSVRREQIYRGIFESLPLYKCLKNITIHHKHWKMKIHAKLLQIEACRAQETLENEKKVEQSKNNCKIEKGKKLVVSEDFVRELKHLRSYIVRFKKKFGHHMFSREFRSYQGVSDKFDKLLESIKSCTVLQLEPSVRLRILEFLEMNFGSEKSHNNAMRRYFGYFKYEKSKKLNRHVQLFPCVVFDNTKQINMIKKLPLNLHSLSIKGLFNSIKIRDNPLVVINSLEKLYISKCHFHFSVLKVRDLKSIKSIFFQSVKFFTKKNDLLNFLLKFESLEKLELLFCNVKPNILKELIARKGASCWKKLVKFHVKQPFIPQEVLVLLEKEFSYVSDRNFISFSNRVKGVKKPKPKKEEKKLKESNSESDNEEDGFGLSNMF